MTKNKGPDERINGLERHLAHQDQTIEDLSATIARQWQAIEEFTRKLARVSNRLHALEEKVDTPAPDELPPPHY